MLYEVITIILMEEHIIMKEFNLGNIVELKKQHPCGSKLWVITRVGADIKIKCKGCGHLIMLSYNFV